MLRHLMAVLVLALLALPLGARAEDDPPQIDRSATGGAQTLDDILRRQEGLKVDETWRKQNIGGDAANVPGMAPLGGSSDPELWRAIRFNELGDVTVTTMNKTGRVLVQDGGMWWLSLRAGPLRSYGGWLLLGTIALLAVFFLIRGRVRIDGGPAGTTITRFMGIERFAHWLTAGSFLLLAFTGLATLFGRIFLAPYLGKDVNATLLTWSKEIHNNVGWAFLVGLVLIFVLWVWHNLPDRTDLTWFARGGGIIGKKHPPAKKFNAGQKLVFWGVVLLGGSITVSGLSLLFPFQLPMFGATFGHLNDLGVNTWFGMAPFPTDLTPQAEMQYAQLWHAIVAFVLMAIVIAHIYIGTVGMEGAFEAMGSGQVDEAWAEQHHSIWYARVKAQEAEAPGKAHPAE